MNHRTATLGIVFVALLAASPIVAQPPAPGRPGDAPKTPIELFRHARDLIREGRFDVAADVLKQFLATNPQDRDYLDLTKAEPTAFLKLRNVAIWSDDLAAQKEALKTVDDIIAKSEQANSKFYGDPVRIGKFIGNLNESQEERLYAVEQLRLAKIAAVPLMVDALKKSGTAEYRTHLLGAISRMEIETIPGFLAAVDGLPDDLKLGLLRAITARSDMVSLLSAADTDFSPHLWYFGSGQGAESDSLRVFCRAALASLAGGDISRRKPEAELTKIAAKFADHTARFRQGPIKIWTYDTTKQLVMSVDATKAQAEEYYGLRYLRWALDRSPNDSAAQDLFLSFTVERAVERAKFVDLADTDPALYEILAAAPAAQLVTLLDDALANQKTALAIGLTQVLAVRADKSAASETAPGKPGVFARGLDYPDPRVRLAAAVGLLRAPVAPTHGKAARVVEVLREAASADPSNGKELGRALIADPFDPRAERTAALLRQMGYVTERFLTGRDLVRRAARASDYDLIVVDRHTANPVLADVLAMLRPDSRTGRQPVFVIASTDKTRAVPLEQQLLRLSLLIAATETADLEIPPPYTFDPRKTSGDPAKDRADVTAVRDRRLESLLSLRQARLKRLVDVAELPYSKALQARLDLRIPQFSVAAMIADPDLAISAASAPQFYKKYESQNRVILGQYDLTQAFPGEVPTAAIGRLIEHLEAALDATHRPKFEQLLTRIQPEDLGLPFDSARDPVLEEQLTRQTKLYRGVAVIPEPMSMVGFAEEVRSAAQDPSQLPRDPAEKKKAAKLAIEWLRRIALGEVAGYHVAPAADAILAALRDDELADAALDAAATLPTEKAQQDILTVAMSKARMTQLRVKAAEKTIRHIQAVGKLIPTTQAAELGRVVESEADAGLKARLATVYQLVAGKPGDLGALMVKHPIPLPQPPAAKEPPPMEEKKP